LPADFLIASDGQLLACKYGEHVYDLWSVDDVLAHVDCRPPLRELAQKPRHGMG